MRKATNVEYWIYLQYVLSYANKRLFALTDMFDNIKDLYMCDSDYFRENKLLNDKELYRFEHTEIDYAYKIVDECEKLGYDIITPDDDRYPKRLMNIPCPPAVLYVKGELPEVDDEVLISVVGTRKGSDAGKSIARELSQRLSEAGAIIVSGGAVGIDYSAHTGALRAGAKTVAVLPCGLSCRYLAKNAPLRQSIAENGALVTEFSPFEGISKNSFQIRNRLISGLSLGTVVIEAPRKSGALITARHALEQGKDIFVVPGDLNDPLYEGSNLLLRDGAIPVITPHDILGEYNNFYPHRLNMKNSKAPLVGSPATTDEIPAFDKYIDISSSGPQKDETVSQTQLSQNAQSILNAFDSKEEGFDDLLIKSKVSASDAISAITELEIYGLIEILPGGRYSLK